MSDGERPAEENELQDEEQHSKLITQKRLPEELVADILSRLPIKPLLRFRCVSKSWLQLLTVDPFFARLFHHQLIKSTNSYNHPVFLLQNDVDILKETHFYHVSNYADCDLAVELKPPFIGTKLEHPCHYKVSGVCHGLFCITEKKYYPDVNYSKEIYIWNPLTADHIIIDCPPIPSQFPDSACAVFGFGFDHSIDDYKVIRVLFTPGYPGVEFHSHVSVYTLGKASWKTLENVDVCFHDRQAMVSGHLHWLAFRPGSNGRKIIVAFDIKDETFRKISYPDTVGYQYIGRRSDWRLGELGGLLSIMLHDRGRDVELWVMKEYGVTGSWTKQFTIRQLEYWGDFRPVSVVKDGETIIFDNGHHQLAIYNPITNSVRKIKPTVFRLTGVYSYTRSLLSPKNITGHRNIIDRSPNG